jgi:hypothetical protein
MSDLAGVFLAFDSDGGFSTHRDEAQIETPLGGLLPSRRSVDRT